MSAVTSVQYGSYPAQGKTALLLRNLLVEEAGQDLIEYALVFTLVGLGVIASMKSLSTKIAVVFSAVGTTLTTTT